MVRTGLTKVAQPSRSSIIALLAGGATALVLAAPALAQEARFDVNASREGAFIRDRNISVRQRPHPEYSPVPKKLGAFVVAPTITGVIETNDNIYATANNEESDVIFHVLPALTARSDWSRNLVALFARADLAAYGDNSGEDVNTWTVGGNSRYDLRRGSALQAGASYGKEFEPRISSGTLNNSDGPQKYDLARAYVGGTYTFNRLRVLGQVNYEGLRFDDLSISGVDVSRAFRDRDAVAVQARGEYGISPATSIYLELNGNDRASAGSTPGVPPRDSKGSEVLVGVNFDMGGLTRGEIAVGYLDQNYDNAAYEDVSGASVHAKFEYFPTQLLTLSVTLDNSVEDAAIINSSGYLAGSYQLRADYEVLRNLIVSGTLNYNHDDYRGIDRVDKRATAGVTANWLLNRSLAAVFSYQFTDQNSIGVNSGRDFTVNRFAVGVTQRF